MPSEPNAINYLLSGALGAVISAFILLVNNYLSNKFQSEREEKQRTWQLEREEQQQIWHEKSEQKKWYREKIYNCYRKAIQLLTKMMQIEFEIKENYKITQNTSIKFHKLSLELMSEFDIIIHSYPIEDYEEFDEKINEFSKHLGINSIQARAIITEIMENDSRIKSI